MLSELSRAQTLCPAGELDLATASAAFDLDRGAKLRLIGSTDWTARLFEIAALASLL